jgi:hypothetical protein
MSQSTTDAVDEPTQPYTDTMDSMGQDGRFNTENWPHDRQPGWSQYSSQDSDVSRVLSSLDVPLAQGEPEVQGPIVLVPETPGSTPTVRTSPNLSKDEAEARMGRVTTNLESIGYTVFTHKTKYGETGRIMHLAFCMYDE